MKRSRPLRRYLPTLILIALISGCSPPAEEATTAGEVSEPETAGVTELDKPPKVVLPDGFKVTLEVATTAEERNRGLMFRTSLDENRGMLFVFDTPGYPSFWMKDTWVALDLLFVDESGTVREMTTDVPPCAAEPCPLYSTSVPVVGVLEVAAGVSAAHGVEIGSKLTFNRVPNLPRRPAGQPPQPTS